jgi:hypothetical protein
VEERAVDIVARVERGGENCRERRREQQPPGRREEERREPQGGALHEEPRERRRHRVGHLSLLGDEDQCGRWRRDERI